MEDKSGRKGRIRWSRAEANETFKVVYKLRHKAVENAPELAETERKESTGIFGYTPLEKQGERSEAYGAAESVKYEFLARLERGSEGVGSEFFSVSVLRVVAYGIYELDESRAEKLSGSG